MREYVRPVKWRSAACRRVFTVRLARGVSVGDDRHTTYLGTPHGGAANPANMAHNERPRRAIALIADLHARGYGPVARKGATGFTFVRVGLADLVDA